MFALPVSILGESSNGKTINGDTQRKRRSAAATLKHVQNPCPNDRESFKSYKNLCDSQDICTRKKQNK
jgi:hypothetical protein